MARDGLSESERLLIVEGLKTLKVKRRIELANARTASAGQRFDERDYSIPEIERLLAKLDASTERRAADARPSLSSPRRPARVRGLGRTT